MKKLKRFPENDNKYKQGEFQFIDIFFYLKLIGIILFTVIDHVIDGLYYIGKFIVSLFRKDTYDSLFQKYSLYMEKINPFLSREQKRKKRTLGKKAKKKKIKKQIFSPYEEELIFGYQSQNFSRVSLREFQSRLIQSLQARRVKVHNKEIITKVINTGDVRRTVSFLRVNTCLSSVKKKKFMTIPMNVWKLGRKKKLSRRGFSEIHKKRFKLKLKMPWVTNTYSMIISLSQVAFKKSMEGLLKIWHKTTEPKHIPAAKVYIKY